MPMPALSSSCRWSGNAVVRGQCRTPTKCRQTRGGRRPRLLAESRHLAARQPPGETQRRHANEMDKRQKPRENDEKSWQGSTCFHAASVIALGRLPIPVFCNKSRHAWSSMLTGACLLHTIIRHQGSPRPTRHSVAWQEPTCRPWGFITLLVVLRYQPSRLRSGNRLGLGQLVAMKHVVLNYHPKSATVLLLILNYCPVAPLHRTPWLHGRGGPALRANPLPGGRHAGLAVILQIPQACNPELAKLTSQCMAVWATWRPESTAMKFGQRCGLRTPSTAKFEQLRESALLGRPGCTGCQSQSQGGVNC